MLEKITGESIVLETLENLDAGHLTVEEALELMCIIIRENLAHFAAVENIHNAGKIANLLSVKLFPSRPLNRVIVEWIREGRYQDFRNDSTPMNDIDSEYAVLRGCAVLLITVKKENPSEALRRSSERLYQYIESIGALQKVWVEY